MIIDPSVLVVFVLATCLACIYMVFFFGRRLQNSAYLRDSLIEAAKQQELNGLQRELLDKALAGPLDGTHPPPQGYGSTRRLWKRDEYSAGPESDWIPAGETEAEKTARLEKKAEREKQDAAFKRWEDEENVRYDGKCKENEALALKRAQDKIPSSIDISLLGGGWAFLLEFSTVIVIIFTVLSLRILKVLEGREIATILAAIAGYVLGKATSNTKQPEQHAGHNTTPSPNGKQP